MAETELSILSRQCLDRRLDSKDFLTTEVAAWEQERNARECKIDWQFTTADARVKLKRLTIASPSKAAVIQCTKANMGLCRQLWGRHVRRKSVELNLLFVPEVLYIAAATQTTVQMVRTRILTIVVTIVPHEAPLCYKMLRY